MIEAVIFDMDGLLIDSEPFWRQAESAAFQTVGINLTEDDMKSTMGKRIDEVVAYWYHEHPWTGASQKDIEALIVDTVINLVKSEATPMPGVEQSLKLLQKNGIPMAIASSSSTEIINTVVDSLSIREYFSHIYSAEHETHGKPHPGVYISTAGLLHVPPHRCLAIEDSPSGVLAAKAAKMKCIAIPEKENRDNSFIQIADVILNSLEEFDDALLASI